MTHKIADGLPQRSNLGPFLLMLIVNGLNKTVVLNVVMFAEYLTFHFTNMKKKLENLNLLLSNPINQVNHWYLNITIVVFGDRSCLNMYTTYKG